MSNGLLKGQIKPKAALGPLGQPGQQWKCLRWWFHIFTGKTNPKLEPLYFVVSKIMNWLTFLGQKRLKLSFLDDIVKAPSQYYVSIFLDFFWPTHRLCQYTYSTDCQQKWPFISLTKRDMLLFGQHLAIPAIVST